MRLRQTAAVIALVVAGAGFGAIAAPEPDSTLMKSAVFQWESLEATKTAVGAVRRVVRAPTATLDELESHITTLEAGKSPHPPHQHANEEVIIVKEGAVEAYVNGTWVPASTGSLIFFASNHPHTVRNVGTVPATYHVLNWASPGTLEKEGATR
jgi:XRE family transcriptional regulator, regulator of sulfur utilization